MLVVIYSDDSYHPECRIWDIQDLEDAKHIMKRWYDKEGLSPKKAFLIKDSSLPVERWIDEWEKETEVNLLEQEEMKDKREFERLSKKYGDRK